MSVHQWCGNFPVTATFHSSSARLSMKSIKKWSMTRHRVCLDCTQLKKLEDAQCTFRRLQKGFVECSWNMLHHDDMNYWSSLLCFDMNKISMILELSVIHSEIVVECNKWNEIYGVFSSSCLELKSRNSDQRFRLSLKCQKNISSSEWEREKF